MSTTKSHKQAIQEKKLKNYCFIDAQNLHLGTKTDTPPWKIDYEKLRIYLRDKYNVAKAYYFIGYEQEQQYALYQTLQEQGYIVMFRPHSPLLISKKKGNVDIDLVLEVMKKLIDDSDKFDKIILVSGDGDFKLLVDYLIKKERFGRILFPNKKRSSLYRLLATDKIAYLSEEGVKRKIERTAE